MQQAAQTTVLDPTLAARVREAAGVSWSAARELCLSGRVSVDGVPATDPAARPPAESRVEIAASAAPAASIVVHLDGDVVVVRKAAGLLTVPFDRGDKGTLLDLARVAVRRLEAARGGGRPTLRAVQRLDKESSGLVVFARSIAAQRDLQEQLREHTVLRRYRAIAHGAVSDANFDTLLLDDRGDGLRGSWGVFRIAPGDSEPPPAAKRALTRVRTVERLRGATLVACELGTGRQHQIRIHLAEAGHPLVGETVYVRDFRGPRLPAPRPMLHAEVLGFVHPRTGQALRFADEPPADFAAVLAALRSLHPKGAS
ncbi:MAG TPA: RluA family pseudouridine synthase [Thermoanaerobaculia bacterium]